MESVQSQLGEKQRQEKVSRRRTFAIISHPDAGKTTLTEKMLLYGGALSLAGSVTARKDQRASTSDWMDLEKQRGISVSSTVLQFDYNGYCMNLLDTPGHRDFSEDTYRVLTAVDAVVMVVDAAKGIEQQTRKLFEICRRRGIPIFTFVNKLDRPTKPLLELLDEIETVLGIEAIPVNWPLGDGPFFRGVYDRLKKRMNLFERTKGGAYRAPVKLAGIDDPEVGEVLPPDLHAKAIEDLELLERPDPIIDEDAVLAGEVTPVFFGSAISNFGVELLLNGFLEMSPEPMPRKNGEAEISPASPEFSSFIFKVQANMNPKHRDRVAFLRVVSGCFERDMTVWNTRTGQKVRLSNSQRLFAQERETVDEAWAGDVVGIVGNQDFQIGDTLSAQPDVVFHEIPEFPPECFAYLYNSSPAKYKRFRAGVDQLMKEGVARLFEIPDSLERTPLLGAVGPLQFEVLQYRLEMEYGATTRLEMAPWREIRWLNADPKTKPDCYLPADAILARDTMDRWVVLIENSWALQIFEEKNPAELYQRERPGNA